MRCIGLCISGKSVDLFKNGWSNNSRFSINKERSYISNNEIYKCVTSNNIFDIVTCVMVIMMLALIAWHFILVLQIAV